MCMCVLTAKIDIGMAQYTNFNRFVCCFISLLLLSNWLSLHFTVSHILIFYMCFVLICYWRCIYCALCSYFVDQQSAQSTLTICSSCFVLTFLIGFINYTCERTTIGHVIFTIFKVRTMGKMDFFHQELNQTNVFRVYTHLSFSTHKIQ